MKIGRVVSLSLLAPAVAALVLLACGGATRPADRDRGGGPVAKDAAVEETVDADAGVEEGVFLPPLACGRVERIDTEGGLVSDKAIVAGSFAGKTLVSWQQYSTSAAARFFDGTSWLAPTGFDPDAWRSGRIAVDGKGRAFLNSFATVQPDTVVRRVVFDFATGLFAPPTTVDADVGATTGDSFEAIDIAALPGGGALSVYRAVDGIRADRWSSDTGAWAPSQIIAPREDSVRIATNAAGQAVAVAWSRDFKGNVVSSAITFDGSSWSAPSAPYHGISRAFVLGVLPSGEGVIATSGGYSPVEITRVRPGLAGGPSEFLAPEPVVSAPGPKQGEIQFSSVAVDALGRITVAWTVRVFPGPRHHVFARRYISGAWAETQLLGHAPSVSLAVDPASNSVVALTVDPEGSPVNTVAVQRVAADANTWSAPIATGMVTDNASFHAAVGFRSSGAAIVFAKQALAKQGERGLFAATCN